MSMSWKIDQTLKLQDECLFGDRLVKGFAERPRSIDALLRDVLIRNPGGEAIVDGDDRVSYAAFDKIVDRIAADFAMLGVVKGDRIALLLPNSATFIEPTLAAARIGAITVPINDREPTPALAYVLDHSDGHCHLNRSG